MSNQTIQALVATKAGSPHENLQLTTIPKPKPGPSQLLVKVMAVSLNPVDWKMAKDGIFVQKFPLCLGCDFAGVVETVGAEAKNFSVGEEVCGFAGCGDGGGYHRGTFSTHIVVNADLVMRKPSKLSFEQAATLGCAAYTAAFALFDELKLNPPMQGGSKETNQWILVWGGSSSVGSFAIQLATLAGYRVVATASAKNIELVKRFGAKEVFDYKSRTVVDDIMQVTGNQIHLALDTVGSDTATMAVKAMSKSDQGHIVVIAGKPQQVPQNITVHEILVGKHVDSPQGCQRLHRLADILRSAVESGKLQVPKTEQIGGLREIPAALKRMADGQVSATKYVAKVAAQ